MRLRRDPAARAAVHHLPIAETEPEARYAHWQAFFAKEQPIMLEIGMGRGAFLRQMAAKHPEYNWLGLERMEELISNAAEPLTGETPPNLRFTWGDAGRLERIFAPGEIARIYINFPDPWPRRKHAHRRLLYRDRLLAYRRLLPPGGELLFRTDSEALFAFAEKEFAFCGYTLSEITHDLAAAAPPDHVQTEYEAKFTRRGMPIHACRAKTGALPAEAARYEEDLRRMMYVSTRSNYPPMLGSVAIHLGMVPGGGLFVPQYIPNMGLQPAMKKEQDYVELCTKILKEYLPDYDPQILEQIVFQSYLSGNFKDPAIAPLLPLADGLDVLELWHGPTAAFKDMALQIMPRLLSESMRMSHQQKEIVILVATSGDTGKAALEGFKDVPGVRIVVFYPAGGVSPVQERQMTTTTGSNTAVYGVRGNFDDCQSAVKAVFGDDALNEALSRRGIELSSANSINWGRLLPQIVYYYWAYNRMIASGRISAGTGINVVVPTGNFGNILAGYYAKRMGLPIRRLICASNENKILTDVLNTGVYDRRRQLILTSSPSMDILISSNFERFLFEMCDRDGEQVSAWMRELNEKGVFSIPDEIRANWADVMWGAYADEAACHATIKDVYEKYHYVLDTHTAVGASVHRAYVEKTGDKTPTVLVSTASPLKFSKAVLEAIGGQAMTAGLDDFAQIDKLAELAGCPVPDGLRALDQLEVRHQNVIDVADVRKIVENL